MSKRLDRSELEARRIEAGKLLQRGVRPAEVARRLSVSRTSVGRWQQMLTSGGRRSLRGAPRTGRPPLLDANDQKRLIAALKAGALAQGYSSDLWTLGRVGKLIETSLVSDIAHLAYGGCSSGWAFPASGQQTCHAAR